MKDFDRVSYMDIAIILFLIFSILKFCNVIEWSWFWIFSILWIPIVYCVLVMVIVYIGICLTKFYKKHFNKDEESN